MTTRSTPLLLGVCLAVLAISGCTTQQRASISTDVPMAQAYVAPAPVEQIKSGGPLGPVELTAYDSIEDGGFKLPAIPVTKVAEQFRRQRVVYNGEGMEPGTVVVDTKNHFLYVVEPQGTAMRYGIGVGKAGFS